MTPAARLSLLVRLRAPLPKFIGPADDGVYRRPDSARIARVNATVMELRRENGRLAMDLVHAHNKVDELRHENAWLRARLRECVVMGRRG